jgi:hypothetical protein
MNIAYHIYRMSRQGLNLHNPVQAQRSSGYEIHLTRPELRRSSTHFGVDGHGKYIFSPGLHPGLQKLYAYGVAATTLWQYKLRKILENKTE